MLDEEFLKILACPYCKGDIRKKEDYLLCSKCGRAYPVLEGIPNLIDDAIVEAWRKSRFQSQEN